MASVTLSLPDPLRDWMEKRIDQSQYESISDYIGDLIRRDQDANRTLGVAEIARSIEDSRQDGRTRPASEVFDRLEQQIKGIIG